MAKRAAVTVSHRTYSSAAVVNAGKSQIERNPYVFEPNQRWNRFTLPIWSCSLALKPNHSFAWKSSGPGFSIIGSHLVEGRAGGSHVSLSLRFEGAFGG